VKERVRPGEGEQDRVSVRALNLLMFVQLLLAGLDVGRLHWSATVPLALQILGLIGFATQVVNPMPVRHPATRAGCCCC
jgi:hypothetical protein